MASKLKKYIKERADMNCSADVLTLSDIVLAANDAIDRARADSRKTVKAVILDRANSTLVS